MNEEKRRCSKCKCFKLIGDFHVDRRKKSGRKSHCKKCAQEYWTSPSGRLAQARQLSNPNHRVAQAKYKASAKGKASNEKYRASLKRKASNSRSKKSEKGKASSVTNCAKRRALKNGSAICDFTAAQWKALQEQCGHRCAYCSKHAKGRLTQDHITPISRGGNHTLSNIVPACSKCNQRKGAGAPLVPVQPSLLVA